MPQHAATANILNTAEPTIVPIPISPSVINVPMTFTKSSGLLVAPAKNYKRTFMLMAASGFGGLWYTLERYYLPINVAPMTSSLILKPDCWQHRQ